MLFVNVFRQYDMAITRILHGVLKDVILKDTCMKAATKYTPLYYIRGFLHVMGNVS
jgi:hypothetical protein